MQLFSRTLVCIMIVIRNVILKPKDGDFIGMQKTKKKFMSISKYYLSTFHVPGNTLSTGDSKVSKKTLALSQVLPQAVGPGFGSWR